LQREIAHRPTLQKTVSQLRQQYREGTNNNTEHNEEQQHSQHK